MSTVQDKSIRSNGSFGYSYYRSGPRKGPVKASKKSHKKGLLIVVLLAFVIAGSVGYSVNLSPTKASLPPTSSKTTSSNVVTKPTATKPAVVAVNHCASNDLDQLILVSVSARHLWVCQKTTSLYDSAVITGDELHPDTITPLGTYHIYGMIRDTVLTGSDSTGSWRDPVSYWMPFLDNKYGAYGLHDATWRTPDQFGNIDPASTDASHGCVELPLATAKWIYDWAVIGTTVTIVS